MKRLERLTAILSYLQSRRFTSITQIEDKFGVSERTIFRDLRSLEEAGVPLGFERDKGYFITAGHFIPPLAFSIEEAKSLIFVEQLARKYTDPETYRNFSSALEKIKNKLKEQQLEQVESLQDQVGAYIGEDGPPPYLHQAEQACSQENILKIEYTDKHGKTSNRSIEPIGLVFYGQTWHIIAFCHLRNDYRDFSVNRVLKLTNTTEKFQAPRLSLEEYIKKIELEENH